MQLQIKVQKGYSLLELLVFAAIGATLFLGILNLRLVGFGALRLLNTSIKQLVAPPRIFEQEISNFNQLGDAVLRLSNQDERQERIIFFDKYAPP